ncbi:RadC family protein [Streptococcus koreensis]|uniref:RadC family protein n=1 Tax=Streptococcus koreensis TaxID=2382163 RepID=UPI0022E05017|nr:DNA repair protein RadC [Streptococcus koreensis]
MYHIVFQEAGLLPRERLLTEGPDKLSNQELLSILLRTGNKNKTVYEIAQDLLGSLKSLKELASMSFQELQEVPGIGKVKAIELLATIELGKRIQTSQVIETEQIMSSQKLAKMMQQKIGHEKQEHLLALYLNTQNQIIHQQVIFIGTVNRSIAEPREILHYAIKHMATSLILVHNHPSGIIHPSKNDDGVTQQMIEACNCLGIVFLDHLIVSTDDYYSYREETDLLV